MLNTECPITHKVQGCRFRNSVLLFHEIKNDIRRIFITILIFKIQRKTEKKITFEAQELRYFQLFEEDRLVSLNFSLESGSAFSRFLNKTLSIYIIFYFC